ncbi:hypothetical protein [Streptomyces sp. NPDC001851]
MLRRLLIPAIPAMLIGAALLPAASATDIGWDVSRPAAPAAAA